MKHRLARFLMTLGVVFLVAGSVHAQDDKPLGPGWLSLDGSVGRLDNKIADGKGSLEKALGLTMGGILGYELYWSSNHPKGRAISVEDISTRITTTLFLTISIYSSRNRRKIGE